MKARLLSITLVMLFSNYLFSQSFRQYFDGADTVYNTNIWESSLRIIMDDDSSNIWQVGVPQKNIFDSAATLPNALLTDSINYYPPNNSSSFQFSYKPISNWGVLAIQWKQKLDMDAGLDGGKIEFSVDSGTTWQNAFSNPYTYNFYGFLAANVDTLPNGDTVFTGTDSLWRDVWLCYDMNWLSTNDSMIVRFTFSSDSIENNKEGWMIDNISIHRTMIHTINEVESERYLKIFPNPASDIIHIEAQKLQQFHIIERMLLVNAVGQVVDEWKNIPTKFFINTRKYSNGSYYLNIKTNLKSETVPIIINHNK